MAHEINQPLQAIKLSTESLDLDLRDLDIENSTIKTYGYGLELDKRLGREAQFHSGSTFGYHSHINRFPEEKLSVFVMSNKGSVWSGTIADELSTLLGAQRAR